MGQIGRNHPCPCGSGKKFKMCCIQKESAHTEAAGQASHESAEPLDVTVKVERVAAIAGWSIEKQIEYGALSLPSEHRIALEEDPESVLWFLDSWDAGASLPNLDTEGGIVILRMKTAEVAVSSKGDRSRDQFPLYWGTATGEGLIFLRDEKSLIRLAIPALSDRIATILRLRAHPTEPPAGSPTASATPEREAEFAAAAAKAHSACIAAAKALAALYRTSAPGSDLKREVFRFSPMLGRVAGIAARAAKKDSIAGAQREVDAIFATCESGPGLPALKGSARQVPFANDIRSEKLATLDRLLGVVSDQELTVLRDGIARVDESGFWIEQKDCTAVQALSIYAAGSHRCYHSTHGTSKFAPYQDGVDVHAGP